MLPQASGASSAHADTKAPALSHEDGVVLLAVDEPSVGHMLERLAAKAGIRVFWVQGLAEGLGWLRDNPTQTALVFLDCHQSEADAMDFCKCARDISPGLPMVLAAGPGARNANGALAALAPISFVAKPYLPTEIAWQLRSHMRH